MEPTFDVEGVVTVIGTLVLAERRPRSQGSHGVSVFGDFDRGPLTVYDNPKDRFI